MKKSTTILALLVAPLLTLTACGSSQTPSTSGGSSTASAQFDKTDLEFTQGMIPHHQQAVRMSQMATSHASSAEVKQLAAGIAAAQGPEIDTMTTWLKNWGKNVPTTQNGPSDADTGAMGMGDGSHMDTGRMPGMMSADDLGRLDKARGATWDRMFLTMMITHHQGAIEMAKTEQAHGKNADAVALAKKIETTQSAEIAKMKNLLTQ